MKRLHFYPQRRREFTPRCVIKYALFLMVALLWLLPSTGRAQTGEVTWEFFLSFNSNIDQLYDMTDNDGTSTSTTLELPGMGQDRYGARTTGYIVPDETGEYDFYVKADDQIELWLSTDVTADNKTKIASVYSNTNDYLASPGQHGTATLYAGESYYFEIYFKENTGGEHASVAWTKPSETSDVITVVGASYISSDPVIDGTLADVKSFEFSNLATEHFVSIDRGAGTIDVDVANGTDLTTLVPAFELTYGTTISPESGSAYDFSSAKQFVLTAQDGTTQKNYTVTVTELPVQTGNSILSLHLKELGQDAVIVDDDVVPANNTITIEYFDGYNTTQTLEAELSTYATSDLPATFDLNNLPETVTVTAQNGDQRTYTLIANVVDGVQGFSDDFSTNTYFSNWECRNWNNSGSNSQYTFTWDDTEEQLLIEKSTSKNNWIRFTFPETLNLLGGGLDVRMRVRKGMTGFDIADFGIKLQDEDAPEGDGNFSYSTDTRKTGLERSETFTEIIWNWDGALKEMDGSRIKYLVMQVDRTTTTAISDLFIDDFRVGADAQPNKKPTVNQIPKPDWIYSDAGQQTITVTDIDDGNPAREETIQITAASSNQSVVRDEDIIVEYDGTSSTATVKYTPSARGFATITLTLKDDRGTVYSDEEDTNTAQFIVEVRSSDPADNNIATFDVPVARLLTYSGQNVIVLPGVDDGDGWTQGISFTATSADESMLTVDRIEYTTGDHVALLYVSEQGAGGEVELTVTCQDMENLQGGGEPEIFSLSFPVSIESIDNPGVQYECYDVQHWQPMPYGESPNVLYEEKLMETYAKDLYNADFFWAGMYAYVTPKISGQYQFRTKDHEGSYLFLSTDHNPENIPAADNPTCPNNSTSDLITLEAGKTYYFIAYFKEIVYGYDHAILWSGPGGLSEDPISAEYLTYSLDVELPTQPQNVQLVTTGAEDAVISWEASTDNKGIEGYNIYVDGYKTNQQVVEDLEYMVTGLEKETAYSLCVRAVDAFGNESEPSAITSFTTWGDDDTPPSIPQDLMEEFVTGVSAKISWAPSTDADSEVRGYLVYHQGETDSITPGYVRDPYFVITGLEEEQTYNFVVKAVDANYNKSEASAPIQITTVTFDPLSPHDDGVKRGRITIKLDPIAQSTGIAVQANYNSSAFLNSNKVSYWNFEHPDMDDESKLGDLGKKKSESMKVEVIKPGDDVEPYAGNQAVKLTGASGQWFSNRFSVHMQKDWEYLVRFAMKKDPAYSGNVTIRIWEQYINDNVVEFTVTPTDEWQVYEHTFTASQTDVASGWDMRFTLGATGVIYMDNVELHIKDHYDPAVANGKFSTKALEVLQELGACGLRWGGIGANGDNLGASSGAAYNTMTYADFAYISNEFCDGYTLLSTGVGEGTDWYEQSNTYANLLEYFYGDDTTPWGKRRYDEGYPNLMDNAKLLVIEYGNEVWGKTSHLCPNFEDYSYYGQWCKDVTENQVITSPYYDADEVKTSISGRSFDNDYGLHKSILENCGDEVDWLSISGYVGGNLEYEEGIDPGESELDYHKNSYESVWKKLHGIDNTRKQELEYAGRTMPFFLYEGNMTDKNYHGRVGQAIAFLDYYATGVERGVVMPVHFHFTGGQWRLLDNTIDYKKRTYFHTTALFNHNCKGVILDVDYSSRDSIETAKGRVLRMESLGAHAYANGENYSILLCSRDFENDYNVQIDLPDGIGTISSPEMTIMQGDAYNGYEFETTTEAMAELTDGMLVTVPKYSVVLITFTADDQSFDTPPLANEDYKRVESIDLYVVDDAPAEITEKGGTLTTEYSVLPDDALFSEVGVSFLPNDTVTARYFSASGIVKADKGNGIITLRAAAFDDSGVYDDLDITMSNQDPMPTVGELTDADILLYPNPVAEYLTIKTPADVSGRISVQTIEGRTVLNRQIEQSRTTLNMNELKSGMYLIRIELSTGTYVSRIMKQ